MIAHIPNPATGAHITIEPTPITAGGRPVVLIDGVLHVVHELAKPGLRLVAQTFDVGAKNGMIAGKTETAPRVRKHQTRSLTASKERLDEE